MGKGRVVGRVAVILVAVLLLLGAGLALRPRVLDSQADSRPERIVSVSPATTEILFAVGAGPQVVGVDDWSNYPPEVADIPKVGSYYPLNIESILGAEPDLIVGMGEQEEWLAQVEEQGVSVLLIDPTTIAEVESAITDVGVACGREAEAERLVEDMQRRLADVEGRLAGIPAEDRVRVYYEVYHDPLMSAGENTLIGDLLVAAGAVNIAAGSGTDWPLMSDEQILLADPDAIVFPLVHGEGTPDAAAIAARPGWAQLAAVQDGRVYSVDPDIFSRPSPRVIDAVETLAHLLYPEAFQ